MSLFSTGGASFPDILIILTLAILAISSLLMTPFVFLHNYRKPRSVPKVLFIILNTLDFLTCVIYPLCAIAKIAKVELHPKCGVHPRYGALCQGWFMGRPTIGAQISTVVGSLLYQSPSCITALLTICRLRQLQFPFRVIPIKVSIILFLLYLTYTTCLLYFTVYDTSAIYNDVMGGVMTTSLFTGTKVQTNSKLFIFFLQCWPLMLCQILSIGASIGTIIHLYKDSLVHPLTEQPGIVDLERETRKRTFKILASNMGSLLQTAAILLMLSITVQVSNRQILSMSSLYLTYCVFVMLPVFLSCYNPLIFILLTPQTRVALKRALRVFSFSELGSSSGRFLPGIPLNTMSNGRGSQES